jgi:G3E family GTPase
LKLVMLTGFLGVGKTTLLLELVRALKSGNDRQFVILENEVGEVGIDGSYLESQGLKVKELFSGCICCQLAADLVTTLNQLQEAFAPDGVFLEPSGMAIPSNILETMDKYCKVVEEVLVVSIVDAERYGILLEAGMPLVINQIEPAQVVAISKIDLMSEEELTDITAKVRKVNPGADIVQVSALERTNLEILTERIGRLWP